LLTHEHGDHINTGTLARLQFERPSLRIGCGEWMLKHLEGFKNVDVMAHDYGKWYDYGSFRISTVKLYHDVPNHGFRILKDGVKVFHATDTAHLQGIEAKDYDLYAIEHNYDEDTIYDIIKRKEDAGEFSYHKGSINSHLSEQQARNFIFNNRKESSKVLRLHESTTGY
jgi:phosphoribosyl 1,2-cyclic phosphodiesterase